MASEKKKKTRSSRIHRECKEYIGCFLSGEIHVEENLGEREYSSSPVSGTLL